MSRPVLLDLFCGRGGWSRLALARGWEVVGYDVADHGYPGRLVREALPVSVARLLDHRPSLVVASPPCEEYARRHLPWLKRDRPTELGVALGLLRWSISLVGKFDCPVVVECSRFAARHEPGARFVGSYALWGDVPLLLPDVPRRKQRKSGLDPAARAMIEPALVDWILHTRGAA